MLTRIKATPKLSKIPVVMYSTTSDPREIQDCMKLGASQFITKSGSFDKLTGSLRKTMLEVIDHPRLKMR